MENESLRATEAVGARGATHPRVTLSDITKNIMFMNFATADKMLPAALPEDVAAHAAPLRLLTICTLVMANGFVVIGKSAPASPENFDADKGREFAYEDAIRQIWPLMGFALRDRLHKDKIDTAAYMRATGQTAEDDLSGLAEEAGDGFGGANDGAVDPSSEPQETATSSDFEEHGPREIPDDEELEGLTDTPVKDLALAYGFDYIDRADAIAKLKVRRDGIKAS